MSPQEHGIKSIKDPNRYAIPLVNEYFKSTIEKSEVELYPFFYNIAKYSVEAKWDEFIQEHGNEVVLREYLNNVLDIRNSTREEFSKASLFQPLISVLKDIKNVDEGKEIYEEYLPIAIEICKEDDNMKALGIFMDVEEEI